MRKKGKEKYMYVLLSAFGVVVFIAFTLSGFYSDIQKRVYQRQIDNMKNLSMQGSAVVEKDLEGHINTLYSLAEFLDEKNFSTRDNIERLGDFLQKREIGFQRLGIADAQGNARVTNGETLNISDRDYFKICMKEKHGATEIRESALIDKPICIISVPVLGEKGESIGIIYGIIEIEAFQIYDNTILEDRQQYIQIIDMDGNYIMKEASNLIGKRDNIFEGLSYVDSQLSSEEIRTRINNEMQVYTEITDGKSSEIVYFTPLKLNDWCVVTVLNRSEITEAVDFILSNDVYMVIFKVAVAVVLLCLVILRFSWQKRRQIEKYNEQLMFEEKIVRIAAEKSGFIIMGYTVRTKQLRFINNTLLEIQFPQLLDNAPVEFMKLIHGDQLLRDQVERIFDSMEHETGKREFYLCVHKGGREFYLRIQLTSLTGSRGEPSHCIGVIEDVTEAFKLRERADRDSLTGLYNRKRAEEIIENCLKTMQRREGDVHACMILDLDNFKTLNDTLGHQMGDRALQDVAKILRQHFRDYDIVCRLGGDEFLVFMKNIPRNVVGRNITSLLRKLNLTYDDGEKFVQITASAGIVLVSDTNCDFGQLYCRADKALYEVKHSNKNNFRIFEQENTQR